MGSFFLYSRNGVGVFPACWSFPRDPHQDEQVVNGSLQGPGRLLMSSLGMPSGPGCLLLDRCLMHPWKVALSMIRERISALSLPASAGVSSLKVSMPVVSHGPCSFWGALACSSCWEVPPCFGVAIRCHHFCHVLCHDIDQLLGACVCLPVLVFEHCRGDVGLPSFLLKIMPVHHLRLFCHLGAELFSSCFPFFFVEVHSVSDPSAFVCLQ